MILVIVMILYWPGGQNITTHQVMFWPLAKFNTSVLEIKVRKETCVKKKKKTNHIHYVADVFYVGELDISLSCCHSFHQNLFEHGAFLKDAFGPAGDGACQ